ncbi:hypothetical protein DFH08DRAFT_813707 [Mycena albidolilacea]|uniref:Uncharacterized protein n=1 Tax=Mycena albidolilacea TaxID=1033008 RepID=A0AAD6ZQR6_9AGAR|nr:hypothetical protein DFH08DRAFT_813707 [Mycena albidolilacea]
MVVNAADYDIDNDGGYYKMSSEESDDSEESDYETYRKKCREKAQARKEKEKRKAARAELQTTSCDSSEQVIKPNGSASEVAELIRKINKMTLDDTEYAPTYYSILALDQTGNAINCVRPPKQAGWNSNGRPRTIPRIIKTDEETRRLK